MSTTGKDKQKPSAMDNLNKIGESLPLFLAYITQIVLLIVVIYAAAITLQTPTYRQADILTMQATGLLSVVTLWLLVRVTDSSTVKGGE